MDGFTGDNPVTAKGVTPGPGWGCDSNLVATWLAPHGGSHLEPSCIPDFNLGLPNGGAFEPTPVSYHASIFDVLDKAGLSWKIYGQASSGGSPAVGLSGGYVWSICPFLAECLHTGQKSNLVDNTQFFADAAAGNLPSLSTDTHPGNLRRHPRLHRAHVRAGRARAQRLLRLPLQQRVQLPAGTAEARPHGAVATPRVGQAHPSEQAAVERSHLM
jgi:hypothetical protein